MALSFLNSEKDRFVINLDKYEYPVRESWINVHVMDILIRLQWLREIGHDFSYYNLVEIATWNGQVDVVKWLITIGCHWSKWLITVARRAEHKDLEDWLLKQECPEDPF